jgi:hypothetical protein
MDPFKIVFSVTATTSGLLQHLAFRRAMDELRHIARNSHERFDPIPNDELRLQIQLMVPDPVDPPAFIGPRVALWSPPKRALVVQYGVADQDLETPQPRRYMANVVQQCMGLFLDYIENQLILHAGRCFSVV